MHFYIGCCRSLYVFLRQSKWQDVGYPLWVIPLRIWLSREVTNRVGVSYSWLAVDTWVLSIRIISDIWLIFSIDEGVSCWSIVNKAPSFVNNCFLWSIQNGIYYMHYVGVAFVVQLYLFGFIGDGFHMQEFYDVIWKNMNPGYRRSSHFLVGMPIIILHDASSALTNFFGYPPTSEGLVPYFTCFIFMNASSSSLSFVCV